MADHHRPRAGRVLALLLATGLVAAACSDNGSSADTTSSTGSTTTTSARGIVEAMAPAVLQSTAELASSLYEASVAGATSVQAGVHSFLDAPTDANLAAARQAWLDARPSYLHTEGLRFSSGPIDTGDNPEGFINSWPLDEQYIDSIISGTEPITADTLRAANERGGENNVSTGWHAIEYLLWGEDTDPVGPGNRPASDYASTDPGTSRRRDYLRVVTDMLVDDLSGVNDQWKEDTGAYRRHFVDTSLDGIRQVLTGIGTLSGGELYGERMSVPYDTKDSEDEHSCFSDNTTEDHKGDVDSIRRIYLGERPDGTTVSPALTDLAKKIDPSIDERIRDALDKSVAATAAIPRPFDQAILGADSAPGRTAIREALTDINAQTDALVALATAMGMQIGTEVP